MKKIQYSIDKIKLEFQFIKTSRIQSFLNSLSMADYDSYYESNNITNCRYNFKFGDGDGAIYLGVIPNWKNENKCDKDIVLEYNPNKTDPFLIEVLSWLKNVPKAVIKVMSFDIAVDMSIPYNSIRMLKRDKREYRCQIGHGEIETRYLGELGHNHVKLYNKAKEQKIKDLDWSRFEITVKKINSLSPTLKEFESLIKIPVLYCICSQISFDEFEQLNPITRIVFESIINDINVLYTIPEYKTRKKYEKLLEQFLTHIDVNIKDMYSAYINFTNTFLDDDTLQVVDINKIFKSQGKI